MPANKNALTRYALIDRMLSSRSRAYSINDITDALSELLPEYGQQPVSKRCVEKDLNYLEYESPFDVEIEEYWIDAADKNDRPYRKRCIRYADPTFSIFKPKLTEDEKTVLTTALDTLGSFEGLDNFDWLNDLKKRLDIEEHEPIISISKNLQANSTLLARLFTVIKLKKPILLKYHSFQNSGVRDVAVSPYLLKEYNNRWYLIASASDTGKLLTFALDRIDDFNIDYQKQYSPAPADLYDRYEDIIGITYIEEEPILEIVFWIGDSSKDYIMTKPIHGSQTSLRGETEYRLRDVNPELPCGGMFFRIRCKRNYELIRELTSFGPELVVLSPYSVVDAVCQRVKESYGRLSTVYSHHLKADSENCLEF